MKVRLLAVAALTLVGLSACSEPPAAPEQPAPTPQAEAAAPAPISADRQGILTDTQRDGLNAANQMSETLQKAEEERRKQMEAQGI